MWMLNRFLFDENSSLGPGVIAKHGPLSDGYKTIECAMSMIYIVGILLMPTETRYIVHLESEVFVLA